MEPDWKLVRFCLWCFYLNNTFMILLIMNNSFVFVVSSKQHKLWIYSPGNCSILPGLFIDFKCCFHLLPSSNSRSKTIPGQVWQKNKKRWLSFSFFFLYLRPYAQNIELKEQIFSALNSVLQDVVLLVLLVQCNVCFIYYGATFSHSCKENFLMRSLVIPYLYNISAAYNKLFTKQK